MKPYRHQPDPHQTTLPSGIAYIVANEAAERFSYYGMRAILVVFMTQYLTDSTGTLALMSEQEAQGYFHLFVSAVYVMPILGALVSDGLLGKYRTIILLSLVYCLGHFALSIDNTRMGLLLGQGLIALGAGGLNPVCRRTWATSLAAPTNIWSARCLVGSIFPSTLALLPLC